MHSSIKNTTSPARRRPGLIWGGVALAFALGVGSGHFLLNNTSESPATAAAAAAKPGLSDSELLAKFRATDWNAKDLQGLEDFSAALGRSEPLRSEVLMRYEQETQTTAKNNLRYLLTAQPVPELAAVGLRWAQQADSAAVRADGFSLLSQQPPSAEIYNLARQAIEQEQDAKALAAATWALNSPDIVLNPAQAQGVIPRLHALTQHPDSEVRAASIQRLAQWDKTKQFIEQDVIRILNTDTNPDTLTAAIGATSISSLNSDALKSAFFKLLENPAADAEARSIVIWQMDRFLLSASEYEKYQRIVSDMQKASSSQQGGAQ